jgi:hypothetical protein
MTSVIVDGKVEQEKVNRQKKKPDGNSNPCSDVHIARHGGHKWCRLDSNHVMQEMVCSEKAYVASSLEVPVLLLKVLVSTT